MEVRQLGRSGIFVSELGLGGLTFGRELDEAESIRLVHVYLDRGGNFIDTADIYSWGASEEFVGKALVGRRDDVVLATKVGFATGPEINQFGGSRRHILMALQGSLKRLRTDWIDVYQVHAFDRTTTIEETLSTLDGLVRSGVVRYIGLSNFAGWQAARAIGITQLHKWVEISALQIRYSLLSRGAEAELLPLCRAERLGVLAWGVLGGGILSGRYRAGERPSEGVRGHGDTRAAISLRSRLTDRTFSIAAEVQRIGECMGRSSAQIALNWALYTPGISSAIVGARTVEQLEDNVAVAGGLAPSIEHRSMQRAESSLATRRTISNASRWRVPANRRPMATPTGPVVVSQSREVWIAYSGWI